MSAEPLPFAECNNCGRKPTLDELETGDCSKCGDSLLVYSIDVAKHIKGLREQEVLLTEVLNRAKFALLASIKGTPEQANDAMGALSLACKAHWDWQTTRIR